MQGLGRFLVYLLVGAAVMATAFWLHAPLAALTDRLGAGYTLFGKPLAIGRFVSDAVALMIPFFGALLAEYLSTGGRQSSLGRILRLGDKSARADLAFVLLMVTPLAMPLVTNLLTFGVVAFSTRWLRAHVPPELQFFDSSVAQIGLVGTVLLFFAFKSFIDYWVHRFFHSPLMWPLHRMHHAATELTPATSVRVHPAGQFLSPLAGALPMLVWAPPEMFVLLFFAFHTYHEMFVHSSADIEWGWIGRYVYGAPVIHRLHHSYADEHIDKNFSTNLLLWDRCFGTYAYAPAIAKVGIHEQQPASLPMQMLLDVRDVWRNVGEMLTRPLARLRTRPAAD